MTRLSHELGMSTLFPLAFNTREFTYSGILQLGQVLLQRQAGPLTRPMGCARLSQPKYKPFDVIAEESKLARRHQLDATSFSKRPDRLGSLDHIS